MRYRIYDNELRDGEFIQQGYEEAESLKKAIETRFDKIRTGVDRFHGPYHIGDKILAVSEQSTQPGAMMIEVVGRPVEMIVGKQKDYEVIS